MKNTIRFIVSLFLMLALITMSLFIFVNVRLLNGNYYKHILEKSDYFNILQKEVYFGLDDLSRRTSILTEAFTGSADLNQIRALSFKNIDDAEAYMKYNAIYKNSTVNEASKAIYSSVQLFNIEAVTGHPQFQSFRRTAYSIYSKTMVPIIMVILFIILLRMINHKRPWRTFLWAGSSFLAAGAIVLLPSLLAVIYRIPYRFSADTAYLKEAFKLITKGYLKYFLVTSVIYISIGAASLAIYVVLSNRVYRRIALMKAKQKVPQT
jgi:hypothetical protein